MGRGRIVSSIVPFSIHSAPVHRPFHDFPSSCLRGVEDVRIFDVFKRQSGCVFVFIGGVASATCRVFSHVVSFEFIFVSHPFYVSLLRSFARASRATGGGVRPVSMGLESRGMCPSRRRSIVRSSDLLVHASRPLVATGRPACLLGPQGVHLPPASPSDRNIFHAGIDPTVQDASLPPSRIVPISSPPTDAIPPFLHESRFRVLLLSLPLRLVPSWGRTCLAFPPLTPVQAVVFCLFGVSHVTHPWNGCKPLFPPHPHETKATSYAPTKQTRAHETKPSHTHVRSKVASRRREKRVET